MAGLGVTEEAAENYKMTLSTLADEPGTHVGVNITELNSYARVRAGEIAANILHQLDLSGYTRVSLAHVTIINSPRRVSAKLPTAFFTEVLLTKNILGRVSTMQWSRPNIYK